MNASPANCVCSSHVLRSEPNAIGYVVKAACTCLQAFGPAGLGIIRVTGVPRVELLRRRLLPLAQRFAVRATCQWSLTWTKSSDTACTPPARWWQ